jgi:hypothetical protein
MPHSFCKIRLTQFADTWSPASPNFTLIGEFTTILLSNFRQDPPQILALTPRRSTAQIGDGPKRTDARMQNRCDPIARTSCALPASLGRSRLSNDHP